VHEIPLRGFVTLGTVRVGDTVRKPALGRTTFVVELLRHLEAVDFDGAPRFLGFDDRGRLMLSYVEGDVPDNLDGGAAPDDQLRAVAKLVRRFHDATTGSALAGDAEVACHNDLSPDNTVYRAGTPVALIDWDNAAPGTRLADVAYAAWLYLDLTRASLPVAAQRRRLHLFADAYGLPTGTDLPAAIEARQRENVRDLEQALAERPAHVDLAFVERALEWNRSELAWFAGQVESLRG
jgi:aminoglycoside phosphotransferase (APT) family kinase protein